MEFLFLIGRVVFGGYFIYSGISHFYRLDQMAGYASSKNVPMPKAAVIVTGLMLILGGLSIFFGVFVTVGIWILILFLLGVSYMMHAFWTVADPMARMGDMVQFTKNIALIGALLMMFAIPLPWVYAAFF
jgi:putative oxidoreductase